jgi:hypothetical protein
MREDEQRIEPAEDRFKWRAVVNTLTKIRGFKM